jgi:cation diffusion facilitator family transporter
LGGIWQRSDLHFPISRIFQVPIKLVFDQTRNIRKHILLESFQAARACILYANKKRVDHGGIGRLHSQCAKPSQSNETPPSANNNMNNVQPGLIAAGVGMAVNIVLAIIKIVTGVVGHSYALVADGIESTADIVSSLIVWTGLKISAFPPDAGHPYGHGKAESIAAIVVSFSLLGAAGLIAVQSVREIIVPHHTPAWFTLLVLALVITTKETLYRFVFKVGHQLGSTAVKGDAWHHRSDAITSAAAFVGISIALIGGKGYESADDWAALLACGIIGFNGFRIFRAALDEIMDAAVPAEVQTTICREAAQIPGVIRIDESRIRKSGLGLFVDLQVRVDGNLTVRQADAIAEEVSRRLKSAPVGVAGVMVHIEPE